MTYHLCSYTAVGCLRSISKSLDCLKIIKKIYCKVGTMAKGKALLANILTSRATIVAFFRASSNR